MPAIALIPRQRLRTTNVTAKNFAWLELPDDLSKLVFDLSDLSGVGEFVTAPIQAPCS